MVIGSLRGFRLEDLDFGVEEVVVLVVGVEVLLVLVWGAVEK